MLVNFWPLSDLMLLMVVLNLFSTILVNDFNTWRAIGDGSN